MKKKTKETSGYANLMNLKIKPSDYLPGRYEQQMTIDDLIPEEKTKEILVIKSKSLLNPELIEYWHRAFVEQRRKGTIVIPSNFEVIGYFPANSEIKAVNEDETNDAEKFIDDFLEGKYD